MTFQANLSRSDEQAGAEPKVLDALNKKLNLKLHTHKACEVTLDGYSEQPLVLCEIFAHIGKPRGGQLHKPMKDALKMLWVEKCLSKEQDPVRKILVFVDPDAAKPFQSGTWYAKALHGFGIEVEVVDLDETVKSEIRTAQKRQRMENVQSPSIH